MAKKHYLAEGYCQLTDTRYYKKLVMPLFHLTSVKVSEILKRLRIDGVISDKPHKNHKSGNNWTVPGTFLIQKNTKFGHP